MTKAEIETGVALLARGRKQDQLRLAANAVFTAFEGRCLAFDCAATPFYADIVMRSKRLGRPMSVEDAQIASVALANALNLATRNRSAFDFPADLTLIDPGMRPKRTPCPLPHL